MEFVICQFMTFHMSQISAQYFTQSIREFSYSSYDIEFLDCNIIDNQSQQTEQLSEVKTAIFPKFIKQLNTQQNLKYKRQLRKKQHSIHNSLNTQFSDLEIRENQSSLKLNKKKRTTFGTEQKSYQKKQSFNNRKRTKSIKKRDEIIKDGNRIIGEWKNQQLHGQVEIFYKNGYFFKGRYQHGIRINGHFIFISGYEYKGGFLGDKFRGYGELKLPNGKIICGDWTEQALDGKAQIRYPTGEIYYGEVKNFKKHGKGYLFFNEGRKYVGQFHDGHITGNGQYFENQKLIAKGYWVNGQLVHEDNDYLNQQRTVDTKLQVSDESQPQRQENFKKTLHSLKQQ